MNRRVDIFFENNIFKDFPKPMSADAAIMNIYLYGNVNTILWSNMYINLTAEQILISYVMTPN